MSKLRRLVIVLVVGLALALLVVGCLTTEKPEARLRERISIDARDDAYLYNQADLYFYNDDHGTVVAKIDGEGPAQFSAPTAVGTATPGLMIDCAGLSNCVEVRDSGTPVWTIADGGGLTSGNVDLNGSDLIIDADGDSVLDENTDDAIRLTLGATTGTFSVLTGNFKVGNGSPTTSQDAEDAYVEGGFEVDGTSRLDGTVDVNNNVDIDGASDETQLAVTSYTTQTNDLVQFDGGLFDVGGGTYGTVDGDNDVGIDGDLEVNGTARLDGTVDINNDIDVDGVADETQLVVTGYTTQTNDLVQFDGGLFDVGTGTYDTADGDNDVGVDGDLEVNGVCRLDGSMDVNDNFDLDGIADEVQLAVTGYTTQTNDLATFDGGLVDIGGGSAYDTADGDNDLGVDGDLEVDATARFDGAIDANSTVNIDGGLTDIGGGSYGTANGDDDLGVAGDLEVEGSLVMASGNYPLEFASAARVLYVGTSSSITNTTVQSDTHGMTTAVSAALCNVNDPDEDAGDPYFCTVSISGSDVTFQLVDDDGDNASNTGDVYYFIVGY